MQVRAAAMVLALVLVGVLAVGTAQGALIYEYDAALDPDGGANGT